MKESMIEIHKEALESSIPAYHEFLLYYEINEQIVYGFVEGKDDPAFYRGIIENSIPNDWKIRLIRSGNKDKVYRIHQQFDWKSFSANRICFFVDRDLSEFLEEKRVLKSNIYVTDNYSIENDLVTFNTMERVLEEVLNITKLTPTENKSIESLFKNNDIYFRQTMAPIMAQIILWRRAKKEVNLNDINLHNYFEFINGKISIKSRYQTPICRIQHIADCLKLEKSSLHEIKDSEKEFREHQGLDKYTRGKYLFWFFIQCALEFHKSIAYYSDKYQSPPKCNIGLGVGNGMTIIATRVRCPSSLREFIDMNFLAYIKEKNDCH